MFDPQKPHLSANLGIPGLEIRTIFFSFLLSSFQICELGGGGREAILSFAVMLLYKY